MTDNIDIIEYLRRNAAFNYRDTYIAAADEIERLRKELDTRIAMCDMRSEKIIELIAERDEARREVCSMNETGLRMNESHKKREAKRRGWDCFKENSNE